MTIHFVEPPAQQRIGGLDAAIRAIEKALRTRGCTVTSSASDAVPGDVVHFHGLWRPEHARLSRQLAKQGIPFLVSPHGMLEPWAWRAKWWKKWPYYWFIERHHLRRAATIVATSPSEAHHLGRMLPRHRIEVLPLGLTDEAVTPDYTQARSSLGWEPDETVLLYLSRIHPKKGLDLLLKALSSVTLPARTRLVIVGGGEAAYVASLRTLADSLRAQLPRIDWVGEVWGGERWPYFQGADLFCLPTHSENFGLAVLEACQVGTPALTTVTTPWNAWLDSTRGVIVEPTVNGISSGLTTFINQSPVQRDQLARWTRMTFAWDVLAPQYEALYRAIADGQALT